MSSAAARRELIEPLVEIALAAGRAILEVYAQVDEHSAKIKGDGSPVTDADARAEEIILAGLAKVSPAIPVVAEEAVAAGRVPETRGHPFYLVDPLDGTKEFLSRNGDFTVNIGLIEKGQPVLGVVYAPAIGELYVGIVGHGARRASFESGVVGSWKPIQACAAVRSAVRVIASRSHLTPETSAFIARFQCAEFVSAGSSLKFCRVACGQADLYPRLARTMEWDTAAADAVLRAAGGRVITLDGQALEYGKREQANDTDFANPGFIAAGAWDPLAD
jgi:3'(2'), 5'-bisphosphate nucleotidase